MSFQHIAKTVCLSRIFFVGILMISEQDLRSALGDQKDQASFLCLIALQLDHIGELSRYAELIFCLE